MHFLAVPCISVPLGAAVLKTAAIQGVGNREERDADAPEGLPRFTRQGGDATSPASWSGESVLPPNYALLGAFPSEMLQTG